MFHPSDDHPYRPRGSRAYHDVNQPSGAHGHYDPQQPRVPRGHPDGGQWTSTGAGQPGDLADASDRVWPLSDLAELPAPDLRKPIPRGIYPEYAQLPRPKATSRPDTSPRPAPTPSVPTPLGSPRGQVPDLTSVLTVGLGLWWLHRRSLRDDGDDGYAVVGVEARELRLDPSALGLISERGLTLEEAEKYCPDLGLVQRILNMARDKVGNRKDFEGRDQGDYGKAVDAKFKELLGKLNGLRTSRGDQRIFIIDETFGWNPEEPAYQNTKFSKTPDAFQKRPNNVCTYEITTEEGAGYKRDSMLAIFINMTRHESMKGITNFVMTRVRPSTPPPPPRRAQ